MALPFHTLYLSEGYLPVPSSSFPATELKIYLSAGCTNPKVYQPELTVSYLPAIVIVWAGNYPPISLVQDFKTIFLISSIAEMPMETCPDNASLTLLLWYSNRWCAVPLSFSADSSS